MEEQVTRLVDKVWNRFLQTPLDRRLIIAIGGMPGSGKTTLSQALVAALNARYFASQGDGAQTSPEPVAVFVPMDGFHLTRAQLAKMPDPEHAFARRGAEFTFDGLGYLELVRALHATIPIPAASDSEPETGTGTETGTGAGTGTGTGTVLAPAFDHAVKDPVPDAIRVGPRQRIVVLEGNYAVMSREPWRSAALLADERWFVRVDPAVARRRLVRRHVAAGIAADEADADRRARENDLPNGEEIARWRLPVDEEVESMEDGDWAH